MLHVAVRTAANASPSLRKSAVFANVPIRRAFEEAVGVRAHSFRDLVAIAAVLVITRSSTFHCCHRLLVITHSSAAGSQVLHSTVHLPALSSFYLSGVTAHNMACGHASILVVPMDADAMWRRQGR
jgi:hypothetical protein